MTSFDIAAITFELNRVLQGARINNIYQINPTTILLSLHKPAKPPLTLLIESGKRIHLTAYKIKKPPSPPSLCMSLRKHLNGGFLQTIKQHEFERIISLVIKTKEGLFQLVAELFGKGNLILVDSKNFITLALTYRRMRDRNILKGKPFFYPPPSGLNPLKIQRQALTKLREQGDLEVVRGLVNTLSIGGTYAEEILLRAQLDKTLPCRNLSERHLDKIYEAIRKLALRIEKTEFEPCIVLDKDGSWIDVLSFPLFLYREAKLKPYPTFNEAIDDYFTKISAEKAIEAVAKKFREKLEAYNRVLRSQQTLLEELHLSIRTNRKIGDLIYTHLNELQTLIQRTLQKIKIKEEWKQIEEQFLQEKERGGSPAVYFDSLSPQQRIIRVKVDGEIFPLHLHLSAQENAARFYEKAKRAQRKLGGLQKAIGETEEKIRKLTHEATCIPEKIPSPRLEREKAWFEKFRWFHSSEGFLVIGGRDAITNELIIKRHMEPHDVVFHADIPGAPFVIIKTAGRKPSGLTLQEAAQFAASYSRAWREGLGAIDTYWVKPEQVSKAAPPGHFLKKGMFMIRGPRNYMRNVTLRLAVGVKKVDGEWIIIGGPPSAIKSQSAAYIEIIPGRNLSAEIAKQIRLKLVNKLAKPLSSEVSALALEEFQKVIPSGKSEIT